MAHKLSFEGRERQVELFDWDAPAAAQTGDDVMRVRVARPAPDAVLLEIGGRCERALVAQAADGLWVWHAGRARFVPDDNQQERAQRRRKAASGPRIVTPPTPATVVRLLVEVGQHVAAGQGLIVVSAMKMETTLASPHEGVVVSIDTEVGATVRPGEVLVEVEPDSAADDSASPPT